MGGGTNRLEVYEADLTGTYTVSAGSGIAQIAGVSQANIAQVAGVAEANIDEVAGVTN